MLLESWFRLSQYLTLGLSCAALVFAEVPFLPELQLCLAPLLALLLLAWWVEERWSLPNWGANLLGLFIFVGGGIWLMTHLREESVLSQLPLHLALLPYMGPLSMAALLVKVYRLHDANHFWHLQGWGLLQIGLGCLLDGGPAFGVMMTAYLACDLICLTLHYRLSSQKVTSGEWRVVRKDDSFLDTRHSPLVTFKWQLGFALRWTLLISATSLLIFLLTPRRDSWSWEPLSRVRAGSRGGNQGTNEEMNLNNTGRIDLDDAIAVRISASDAVGEPKLDLPADQRWRGNVLDWYEHGRWTTMHLMPIRPRRINQVELPHFGPDQFFLTFTVQPRQAGGLVLAEPIRLGAFPNRLPVIVLGNEERRRRLFAEFSSTVLSQVPADQRREYRYCQVIPVTGDPERNPAEGMWPRRDFIELLKSLPATLRGPLYDWTINLLSRLVQYPHYGLPQSVHAALAGPNQHIRIAQSDWEAVARALTDYLSNSGAFTYTLEIVRHNPSIDPVMDFLQNTRQGHCERFAAALALMLRSVGIPSRVVKGYRGCDSQGGGQYVIRHSHSHAWVEILVPHNRSTNASPVPAWRSFDWLTLDATPPEPGAEAGSLSFSHLWEDAGRFCLQWWRALILEYDGDEQADLWKSLMSGRFVALLLKLAVLAGIGGAAMVVWMFLRRLRLPGSVVRLHLRRLWLPRNPANIRDDASLYTRLVQILTRSLSLRPSFGQTPQEYSTAAQTLLQSRPALIGVADLPRRIVALFYRVRFGGQPLEERERQQIETDLDRFTAALESR